MADLKQTMNSNSKEQSVMKLIGKAKIKDLKTEKTKNGKLIAKGQIYFTNKVGEDKGQPVFESDFINATFVGRGLEKVLLQAKTKAIAKLPIYISESSFRNRSYKDNSGAWKSYTEVVVFDIEDIQESTPTNFNTPINTTEEEDLPF